MQAGIVQRVAPLVNPVDLPIVKAYLKVEHSAEDALIEEMVAAVTDIVERKAGRQLITAEWSLFLPAFPGQHGWHEGWNFWGHHNWHYHHEGWHHQGAGRIYLNRPPLISVDDILYKDTDGVASTVPAADYLFSQGKEPAYVVPVNGKTWPSALLETDSVEVQYTAGYGVAPSDVPAYIREYIKRCVNFRYYDRDVPEQLEDAFNETLMTGAIYGADN